MDKYSNKKYNQNNFKDIDKSNMRNVQNGFRESTSDNEFDDEENVLNSKSNKMYRINKPESDEEEVIEIDSDDSRDGYRNNNNDESSPDRQRAYEQNNNNDSDRESTSSDIVVVRDDYQSFYEEIEQLSKITSAGKVAAQLKI